MQTPDMIRNLLGLICTLLLAATLGSHCAFAAKRVALVIGNSRYESVPDLANPANDARDIAAALRRLGFVVTLALDLDYDGLRRRLRAFSRASHGADIAMLFYAGHGIEAGGINYLIPVDAQLRSDRDLQFEAIGLDSLLTAVQGATSLRVIALDACRNNPFVARMKLTSSSRSIGRGLARVEPAVGTLVSYAAKAGTVAIDGDGRNSPYSKALLNFLEQPGLEISFMFRKVHDLVMRETGGRQEPFVYGSLPDKRYYLKPAATSQASSQTGKAKQATLDPPPYTGDVAAELLFWNSVRTSTDPAVLRTYLEKYPAGRFANLARVLIGKYEKARPVAATGSAKTAAVDTLASTVATTSGDARPIADKARLRKLQQLLYDLNYDPGPIDGVAGARTRAAVAAFRKDHGLPAAAALSEGLLKRLAATPRPGAWGVLGFQPSARRIVARNTLPDRKSAEALLNEACPRCSQRLTFAGSECAAIAISEAGWGWAVRPDLQQARSVALASCAKYGPGCQVRRSLCARR